MTVFKIICTAAVMAVAMAVAGAKDANTIGEPVLEALAELDTYLEKSDEYCIEKELKIKTIENLLHSRGVSTSQQYNILGQLYEEYKSYNFDKAEEILTRQEAIARQMGNKSMIQNVILDKAMLYTTSALFLEANQLLQLIDTTSLDDSQKLHLYIIKQRFGTDYSEYIGSPNEMRTAEYYARRILANAPEDSYIYMSTKIIQLLKQGRLEEAEKLNSECIATLNTHSHEYAIQTYWQGVICNEGGRTEDALMWWIRSAIQDIRGGVKDNASLACIATELIRTPEIKRAFRYVRLSLDDALYYNAKLRPLQIAAILPSIEEAYSNTVAQQERQTGRLIILLGIIAAIMMAISIFAIAMYIKVRKFAAEISCKNQQIAEQYKSLSESDRTMRQTNLELAESNAAKEEYLGLFLSMSSGYLDKLKKHLSYEQMDKELKNFYNTFDTAFIQLYPNFVEDFNALLKEEDRVHLKKDELLNTELRIFALIKLGITQSSHIASLLRYSVNTIYNYRAQIKNSVIEDRENFEDRIKRIGLGE